ncbi:MAG TPA: sulfotransferase, partial [Thermoanaerobaculia bacterium]|nr:sulfotransferase [Thermoanaerobaculia bacterium]
MTLNQTWNPTDGLFILSCHRSGSTLLRFILDTHPELYCPPEVFLGTTAFYMSNFLSGLEGSRAGDGQSVPVLDWIRGILGEQ